MPSKSEDLNDLLKAVRACFQRLKTLGEHTHQGSGITIAMRAVLEALIDDGPATVPQIARTKGVTRQHIQVIVDTLLAEGLVSLRNNPDHLRSPLVLISDNGSSRFAEMRAREKTILSIMARDLRRSDLGAAVLTLNGLNAALEHQLTEMLDNA